MLVEIWSDIACPWCYVGKRRFERALAQFEHRDAVSVVWRSFELDPSAPPRQAESQPVLLARKYGMPLAQAEAMNARMTTEAAKEGLTFRLARMQSGSTFDAHRLLHWAAGQDRREAMVERLFAAYLGEGEALGEVDTLVRLAAEVGLDAEAARAVLGSDRFADAVRRDEARAQALGIGGVPFFAIDARYGVSGAQPPEVILEALEQAWGEARLPLAAVPGGAAVGAAAGAAADGCEDGSCAV